MSDGTLHRQGNPNADFPMFDVRLSRAVLLLAHSADPPCCTMQQFMVAAQQGLGQALQVSIIACLRHAMLTVQQGSFGSQVAC
jgi:hypothetical protein